jgi:hypothetical protein
LVGFHSVVVVVGLVDVVDVEAVVVDPDFFDEPLPLAVVVVVVVDLGPFVFVVPADLVEGPFVEGPFVEGPLVVVGAPFVDCPFVVGLVVVFGEFGLAFVFGAASTFNARAAAATNAAGSAIHLVITPPSTMVEQGTYPCALLELVKVNY